jgi:peptidoglycan/LPS O-acetylase OafA/YrhL
MPHKPQLDGLRFLAFLAVFYFHARPGQYFWGPQGVQVFFTLSGFLITRILILGESGSLRADLERFYIRRTLRIFPLYYAVVAWLWASGLLTGVGIGCYLA